MAHYCFYVISRTAGLALLFLLVCCYIFLALGLAVLGLIALASSLLGAAGVLEIITDLARTPLILVSAGIFLLGAGMCLGAVTVCPACFELFDRFSRSKELRRRRLSDEAEESA